MLNEERVNDQKYIWVLNKFEWFFVLLQHPLRFEEDLILGFGKLDYLLFRESFMHLIVKKNEYVGKQDRKYAPSQILRNIGR